MLIVARWRRLGPAEPEERELAPPRKQYVESLGSVLERTRDPAVALAGLKADARRRLARRTGSEDDAAAARRLGLEPDEADAVTRETFASEDVLPLGRALARLAGAGRETGGPMAGLRERVTAEVGKVAVGQEDGHPVLRDAGSPHPRDH